MALAALDSFKENRQERSRIIKRRNKPLNDAPTRRRPRQERASEGSRHSFSQWRRTFFNNDRFHLTDKDPPIRSSVWEF